MAIKNWDVRLAQQVIRPLRSSGVRPSHLTTLSLVIGLGAAVLYASGDPIAADWGGGMFMLAAFLDHTDGELARLTDQASLFGHYYDLSCDLIVKIALFIGIGIGLRQGALGDWALWLGITSGISIGVIFLFRLEMEQRGGKEAVRQPNLAGFDIEDTLYALGPITWLDGLPPLLVAAGIGAPLFAMWVIWQYLRGF